jgi:hypothetical protein
MIVWVWIIALAAPSIAWAQVQSATYAIEGIGGLTCGRWLGAAPSSAGRKAADVALENWVSGYVTFYNAYEAPDGNLFNEIDRSTFLQTVALMCTGNPSWTVADAVSNAVAFAVKLKGAAAAQRAQRR